MNDLSSATCISCCCYCCCCCFSESFGSTAVYIAIILETSENDYPIPFVETTQTAYEEFNTDSHKVRLSLELLIYIVFHNNSIIASFSYPTLHFKQLLFTVFNILTANIFYLSFMQIQNQLSLASAQHVIQQFSFSHVCRMGENKILEIFAFDIGLLKQN